MNPIQANINNAEVILKATICLHNFLRQTKSAGYCPIGFIDTWEEKGEIKEGEWRRIVVENQNQLLSDVQPIRGFRPSSTAVQVREGFNSIRKLHGRISPLAMG